MSCGHRVLLIYNDTNQQIGRLTFHTPYLKWTGLQLTQFHLWTFISPGMGDWLWVIMWSLWRQRCWHSEHLFHLLAFSGHTLWQSREGYLSFYSTSVVPLSSAHPHRPLNLPAQTPAQIMSKNQRQYTCIPSQPFPSDGKAYNSAHVCIHNR